MILSNEEIEDACEYVGLDPEAFAEALRYTQHKRKWLAEQNQSKGSGGSNESSS